MNMEDVKIFKWLHSKQYNINLRHMLFTQILKAISKIYKNTHNEGHTHLYII